MAVITKNFVYNLIGILIALLVCVIAFYKWSFTYWKRKGIPGIPPSIPFGNFADVFLLKKHIGEMYSSFYFKFKAAGHRHGGVFLFGNPHYIPVDLDIIKRIYAQDFEYFTDRGMYVNENSDPLSIHLFNIEGEKWKKLRAKLSPAFTSGKMKLMFPITTECTKELVKIATASAKNKQVVDVKDVFSRFTTDNISSCAFGIETNSLKNSNAPMRLIGKRFVDPTVLESLKTIFQFAAPQKILKLLNFCVTPRDVEEFFVGNVKSSITYRETNNIVRPDFMNLLLQLKNKGSLTDDSNTFTDKKNNTNENLTVDELTAQCFAFFVGGFETSATTSSFLMYELAKNQYIQDKLREEVHDVLRKHGNQITYDAIMEMTYMDKVVYETLRKYPPVPFLPRICTKEYIIPGTDIKLEEGTNVIIPILGIQNDPNIYPDPEKFDPQRFNEENKLNRHSAAWTPFGSGPRICIGLRFGIMQVKVGLVTLLNNHRFLLDSKTEKDEVLEKTGLFINKRGGIWLNVETIY